MPRRKTSAKRKKTSAPRNKASAPRKKPPPAPRKPRTNSARHTPARPRRTVRRKLHAAVPRRKTAAAKARPRAIKIPAPPRAADPFAKKTGARRSYYTAEFLAEAKRRIETTLQSITAIAAELGMDKSVLWRLVRSQGWVRPPGALRLRGLSPALRLAAQADALVAAPHPTPRIKSGAGPLPASGERERAEPAAPASQANAAPDNAAIERLEAAVLQELGTVETMRANLGKEPQRPIDAERTARTLSVLTETFAKLRRQRLATQPQPDTSHDDMPADIDEFRRDFARRLDAFVASRTGGGSAAPAGPADESDPV
jgi:hypothetical protein